MAIQGKNLTGGGYHRTLDISNKFGGSVHSKFWRYLGLILIAGFTLAPLSASAQFSGTNGQIYFTYQDTSTNLTSIGAANPDGTESHVIIAGTSAYNIGDVTVSANDTKIAYTESGVTGPPYSSAIYIANINGSSPTLVYTAPSGENAGQLSFSADGTYIYFGLEGNATAADNGIYTVPTTGGSATQIVADATNVQYEVYPVAVSVANTKIYYESFPSGSSHTYTIYSANYNGSSPTSVYSETGTYIALDDVLPNGSQLLYASNGTNGQLYTVSTGGVVQLS